MNGKMYLEQLQHLAATMCMNEGPYRNWWTN